MKDVSLYLLIAATFAMAGFIYGARFLDQHPTVPLIELKGKVSRDGDEIRPGAGMRP